MARKLKRARRRDMAIKFRNKAFSFILNLRGFSVEPQFRKHQKRMALKVLEAL